MTLINQAIFATDTVRVGIFRCSRDDPRFGNTGPIRHHIVVFPRTSVWIRHARSKPFVADPTIATVYNQGQEYERTALCPDGDRSDWFAVDPATALAIAREFDPAAGENPSHPFRPTFVRTSPELYARQRQLFRRVEAGAADQLEVEEGVFDIVASALGGTTEGTNRSRVTARTEEAHRDLAHRARAELARTPSTRTTVGLLAARLSVSPFHLCRVFKAQTGTTMHAYRLDLRLRLALERLEGKPRACSALAQELGFNSHSHFTSVFRSRLGLTPSAARRALAIDARPAGHFRGRVR